MPKTITIPTLFLALCIYLASFTIVKNDRIVYASSQTIKVPDDYLTIQEAVNNAKYGDIIFVRAGVYYENIVIDKSIILIGENQENTIINGTHKNHVISIMAPDVTITGFTVCNSYPYISWLCGIFIMQFGNITLYNNKIISNGIGVQAYFSSRNKIHHNLISANDIGVQLINSSNNFIYRNVISRNPLGMDIYFYSTGNMIYENTIFDNYRAIDLSFHSSNNFFYHNNFIKNSYNVYAETINLWNYGNKGNYWEDYRGWDLNKDGVGDIPYNIGEGNIDRYPLMGKFNAFDVAFKGETYSVAIISNSTILNFAFKADIKCRTKTITFNTSLNGFAGFSKVIIPKELMKNIHTVLINGNEVNATPIDIADAKNVHLYFDYSNNCSIEIIYFELLDIYHQLLNDYSGLNSAYSLLVEKFNAFNETFNNLIEEYSNVQKELQDINLRHQNQAENLKGLTYIFAVLTTVLIIAIIYLSKAAYRK